MHGVTGLILAGGAATRMGGADKGWVLWQGVPLIEHVTRRLAPQVERIIISANRSQARYAALGAEVVTDAPVGATSALAPQPFRGPLAGIVAGLGAATTPWVACVPVDAPRVATDLVARLYAAIDTAPAAVALVQGRMEPPFCLLARTTQAALTTSLASGEGSVARAMTAIGAVPVVFDDAEAFANVNTPDDLRDARP